MTIRKVAIVVLDGVGCGAAPDAAAFGDAGADTLGHTARVVGGLALPYLGALGLGHVLALEGVPPVDAPRASWGRLREASAGKDTTTGHWELAGVPLERPMPLFPDGFPDEVMERFAALAGKPALGNVVASGTAILDELGAEHVRTGRPIVYTSADSVFQIAAHEDVLRPAALWRLCEATRAMLTGPWAVGRVIARPFVGEPGAWRRTDRRRDFSLEPPEPTVLDRVLAAGKEVVAVGKIEDIFAHRGIGRAVHVLPHPECIDATIAALRGMEAGLVFTNLIEFDMMYGHRNDPEGMARALEAFDARVPDLVAAVEPDGLLILTADHGNDPTTPGTDHTREEVPLLAVTSGRRGRPLGVRSTFADVAATVSDLLGVEPPATGVSFRADLPT